MISESPYTQSNAGDSEEEYQLQIHGPVRVPCEKELVEYFHVVFGKMNWIALESFKE